MKNLLWLFPLFCMSGAAVPPEPSPIIIPPPPLFVEEEQPPLTQYIPTGPIVYILRCQVTAYTPDDAYAPKTYRGITSTGVLTDEDPYGVAADPRIIPYGSQVMVPGYAPTKYRPAHAWWPVDDTGGALRKSWHRGEVIHLDLRFRTLKAAKKWGTQWLDVEVVLPEGLDAYRRQQIEQRAKEIYQLP